MGEWENCDGVGVVGEGVGVVVAIPLGGGRVGKLWRSRSSSSHSFRGGWENCDGVGVGVVVAIP